MFERNVEDSLLRARTYRKRQYQNVVYPIKYTRQLQDLDNWDHIFYTNLLGRLTIYDFDAPPKTVLDIGCGTGVWIVDAAKRWPHSTFVGFDIQNIQPDLFRCGFSDLATRVQWAHGNFLEPFPFPSSYFDFVRIHNIGFGVPEDEWQDLLQEVARVLIPDGHVEITEEDLIFPCGRPPQSTNSVAFPLTPKSITGSNGFLSTHSTISSPNSPSEDLLALDAGNDDPRENSDYVVDPRDHSRLLESWRNMLHHRFLPLQVVSVLPLYLSSIFGEIQSQPNLRIRIPPNSALAVREQDDYFSVFEQDSGIFFSLGDPVTPVTKDNCFFSSVPLPSSAPSLQLARTFHSVTTCKEAIWEEYEILYGNSPSVSSVMGLNRTTARDEFEFHWANWSDDMMDRIGMRNTLLAALSWPNPDDSGPSSQRWRERCGNIYADDYDNFDSNDGNTEICRSLRSYLVWKPNKSLETDTTSLTNLTIYL